MATALACWRRARFADFIAVDGSPLENITILQDKTRIRHVHIGGKRMQIPDRSYDPRQVTDRSLTNWTDLYTQERVRALYPACRRLARGGERIGPGEEAWTVANGWTRLSHRSRCPDPGRAGWKRRATLAQPVRQGVDDDRLGPLRPSADRQ